MRLSNLVKTYAKKNITPIKLSYFKNNIIKTNYNKLNKNLKKNNIRNNKVSNNISNISNISNTSHKTSNNILYNNKLIINNFSLEKIKNQSLFLQNELSIRLSHRIFDLLKLPYGLPVNSDISNIIKLYYNSFEKIQSHKKPTTYDNILSFTETLYDIKRNHKNIEYNIAEALNKINDPLIDYQLINGVLDIFFLSRISIRTLISHQICSLEGTSILKENNLFNIITDLTNDLYSISNRYSNYDVEFNINCCKNINLLYIESHLYYILNEILKNSIVAHSINNIDKPIDISINETKNYVIIKISDYGKGFCIQDKEKIMSYSFTTSLNNNTDINHQNSYILSGLGFGLPLSNLYIKYFGGQISINSIENIGTDVYIYVNKLKNNFEKLI